VIANDKTSDLQLVGCFFKKTPEQINNRSPLGYNLLSFYGIIYLPVAVCISHSSNKCCAGCWICDDGQISV
jgi:hypothetical protein